MTRDLATGRDLPPDFDAATVAAIDAHLRAVETGHGARLLFAVESGSRAWGFPSPDSDYDCRFVFLRPPADHLRLRPCRDVIEFPIVGDLDVNGWDLSKALALALAGNAVVGEWADAAATYADPHGFKAALAAVLGEIVDPRLVARHHAGLVFAHRNRLGDLTDVPLKKLFYAIRPVAALLWMRARDFGRLPPMNLGDLRRGIDLPAGVAAALDDLLARKAVTRELGTGAPPTPLRDWLTAGFALADEVARAPRLPRADDAARRAVADAFLLASFDRFFPGPLGGRP